MAALNLVWKTRLKFLYLIDRLRISPHCANLSKFIQNYVLFCFQQSISILENGHQMVQDCCQLLLLPNVISVLMNFLILSPLDQVGFKNHIKNNEKILIILKGILQEILQEIM